MAIQPKGLGFIELLVALFILSTAWLGLLQLQQKAWRHTLAVGYQTQAMQLLHAMKQLPPGSPFRQTLQQEASQRLPGGQLSHNHACWFAPQLANNRPQCL